MSRRTPPRKLNLGDINPFSPGGTQPHHSQGIAALFAVTFDLRAGYTISWQEPEDMDISGVEFKSMPSGLHNINEDLVYFVMPPYAGLSAYYRKEAPSSQRNARMVSIGILMPSTGRYGRLGRAWNYAEKLKDLAKMYANNPDDTSPLQHFFNTHYDPTIPTSAYPITPLSPVTPRYAPKALHSQMLRQQTLNRKRSISDTAAPFRGLKLSPYHPAMTFPDLISTFGPLIFVLYRAALCRKRILFLTHVPIERTCHFVYNTSVLATIPPSVSDLILNEPNRLRTLFSVGVSDIPMLEQYSSEPSVQPDNASSTLVESTEVVNERGWVACTTDEILALKTHLYDILVILPHQNPFPSLKTPISPNHPTITLSSGEPVLPTIRDLRRWKRLCLELPLPRPTGPDPEFDDLTYQRSWAEFVCGGLFWWATAGEAANAEDFENDSDDDYFLQEAPARRGTLGEGVPLLQRSDTLDSFANIGSWDATTPRPRTRSDTIMSRMTGFGEADVGVIVYFHRMTAKIISSLSAIIDANELNEEDGTDELPATKISPEDLMRMGLDWNEREYVRDLCMTWFGRKVAYNQHRSECCY